MSAAEDRPGTEDPEGARSAAAAFFGAIDAGDARRMWDLMSHGARDFVINRALEAGMDFDLASRLREGNASEAELDEYVDELMEGLRRDLQGVDLSRLVFRVDEEAQLSSPDQLQLIYGVRLDIGIEDEQAELPAGKVTMIREGGDWKLNHLRPRLE